MASFDMSRATAPDKIQVVPEDVVQSKTLSKIVDSPAFQTFFYVIIFLNSIVLAIPNYSEIDEHGNLSTTNSTRNAIFDCSDVVFLALFSFELLLKIGASGMIYLNDSWNSVDALVVISGWISYGFPRGGSFVTIFRLGRVFRPLKFLATNAQLRKVVTVIISSAPELVHVAIVAFFAFLFFSIAGLNFFMGPEMHARCRLTPFPVKANWTLGSPFEKSRCLMADNVDLTTQFPLMKKSESPWVTPVSDCFWPVDSKNVHFCSFTSSGGLNVCHHGTNFINESEWTWCGSNYDGFGNPRFTDWKLMEAPEYAKDLRWGHANFDDGLRAFLFVIEVVTLNHWTELMYMVQDAFGGQAALYFVILDLIGTFVIINLFLTSIKNSVDEYKKMNAVEPKSQNITAESREEPMNFEPVPKDEINDTKILDWSVKSLTALVNHTGFKNTRLVFISICTVLLAINHNTTSARFDCVMEGIYFVFTIIFMTEMVVTLAGDGLRKFFSNPLTVLDFLVVFLTFIQACSYPPVFIAGAKYADTLRGRSFGMGLLSWRFARVLSACLSYFELKAAESFFSLIITTTIDCMAFSIIFSLYIYIAALVGMQLFANKLRFNAQGYPIAVTNREAWLHAPDRPRANFDDFFLSIGSVFQIVTSEKWYTVMDDLWRAQGSGAAAFAIITLAFGMYVLLYQLLTFIIDDIVDDNSEFRKASARQKVVALVDFGIEFDPEKANSPKIRETLKDAFYESRDAYFKRQQSAQELTGFDDVAASPTQLTGSSKRMGSGKKEGSYSTGSSKSVGSVKTDLARIPDAYWQAFFGSICRAEWYISLTATMALLSAVQLALDSPFLDPASKYAKVMLILNGVFTAYIGAANIIDILGQGPVQYFSSMWAWGDLTVTVVSVIGLCISNQAMIGVRVVKVLNTVAYMTSLNIFHGLNTTVQAMVGVVPDALFVTWFFSTCLIFFALFTVSSLKGQLRSCHGDVFDKSISQNKAYMSALTTPQEWPAMPADTRQMFAPTSAVFTLYGMSSQASAVCGSSWPSQPCCLDKGTSAPYVGEPLVATSRSYCECWGGSWEPDTIYLFDNVAQAFFTLFQMATMAGWTDLKVIVTDATGIDMQPVRDNRSSWIFFFIVFIFASCFLCINLFIGVVAKSFDDSLSRDEESFQSVDEFIAQIRGKGLTAEQSWVSMFKTAGQNETTAQRADVSKRLLKRWAIPDYEQEWENLSSYRPSQRFATAISGNVVFDNFMLMVIVANTILLAMPYFGATDEYSGGLNTANTVFAITFNVELLINVLAKGPYLFCHRSSSWDAAIVIGTDIEMALGLLLGNSASRIVSLGRMLRMLKLVRMLRLPQLQQLIEVVATVAPAMCNAGIFLFFIVFMFAVIGFKSFAKTAFNDSYDKYANFRSIDVSLLTMFRFLTGQSWDDFMHAAAAKTAGCVDNPAYNPQVCGFNNDFGCKPLNGCGSFGIYPFMIAFVFIGSFCCLSLFVAAIVDGLSIVVEDTLFNDIDRTARGRFVGCWLKYDKQASGFISVKDLEKLVLDDDNPFKLFVALKTSFTFEEAFQLWNDDPSSQRRDNCKLRDAIGVLPLAVKLGQGCLACEVFKVLYFSGNSQLVDLTAGRKLEIETMKLLNRPNPQWVSLREYYAALVVLRACLRYMLRKKYKRKRVLAESMFTQAGSFIGDVASLVYRTISSV